MADLAVSPSEATGNECPCLDLAGLANQLGVQTFTRERKFRERINSWLKLVRPVLARVFPQLSRMTAHSWK